MARLVTKGYSQQPGIDYNETFVAVSRLDTIRVLIALTAQKDGSINQLDIEFAFLNGVLEEEIYVDQPQDFISKGNEDKVPRLRKALYGFSKRKSESTLYIKTQSHYDTLIVFLYVDDLIYIENNMKMINDFKEYIMKIFEMTDLFAVFQIFKIFSVILSDRFQGKNTGVGDMLNPHSVQRRLGRTRTQEKLKSIAFSLKNQQDHHFQWPSPVCQFSNFYDQCGTD
ncbi:hypothetical protein CR513_22733, partial [Mucuna pruriens]